MIVVTLKRMMIVVIDTIGDMKVGDAAIIAGDTCLVIVQFITMKQDLFTFTVFMYHFNKLSAFELKHNVVLVML